MIHNDIQHQLALLVKTSAPPLIEVAQSPTETPQWVSGQRLPAYVLASLPSGRFQVQVEDQILDMNLPRNSEPGQKLELTFISSSPRLTFAMTSDLPPDLARTIPANSSVSLSETAKFLGALLQRGSQDAAVPAALVKTAPVLPGAPAEPKIFANALRNAISQSGLFYESHQAQWVSGERGLISLMQEPQAKFPVLANPNTLNIPGALNTPNPLKSLNMPNPAQTAQSNSTLQPNSALRLTDGKLPPGNSVQSPPLLKAGESAANTVRELVVSQTSAQHSAELNPTSFRELVHPLAVPLVNQQLEALDSRQILWQGQVWPGQEMNWEIEEDGSHGTGGDDEAPRWRTRLHLDLPGLGGVTARLAIDGGGVRIEMTAERNDSAALLRGEVGQLARSMEASGLKVAGLMVQQHGLA